MIKDCIGKLVEGEHLTFQEALEAMREMMSGGATNSQIASFITALRMKGETAEEIAALTTAMKSLCNQIHPKVSGRLVDTCGTGGDRVKTFNISTASAFVVAGAGVTVAKHGNRSFTSKSGSADVLERLGVNLNQEAEAVEDLIEKVGIGFMFAPVFHPAMSHAVNPRKEIGIRTVFNILGPLSNPAGADSQLLGVYSPHLVDTLAQSLLRLECEEAMVVHGMDGLDEISTIGRTLIAWLREAEVKIFQATPRELGVHQASSEDLKGGTPEENAEVIYKILTASSCVKEAKRDIVLINAAAGIMVGGGADSFQEGLEQAQHSIMSGEAYKRLKMMIKAGGGNPTILERMEATYV